MEANQRFLIIDDSPVDQLVTSHLLKDYYQTDAVFLAEGGRRALQWLIDNEAKLDGLLLLLDIKMPEMDGFAFLEAFAELPASIRSQVRIFMLSSTLDPLDLQRAKEHPLVIALLSKPLQPSLLSDYLKG